MIARTARVALAAVLACAALTACVGIPTSGGVTAGQLADDENAAATDFLPEGPSRGDTPEQILAGFMDAAKGPQNNFSVARLFLSEEFERTWQENAGVLIYSGTDSMIPLAEDAIDYAVTAVATVDANGRYVEEAPAPPQVLSYSFGLDDAGEWRITGGPDGIVLSQRNFALIFSTQSLYFFDSTYSYLVPDVRWFPRRGSTSLRVVRALVGGQSEWLGQGVTVTSLPEGVELLSVRNTGGVVEVDLTEPFLTAPDLDKQRFRLQLASSLGSVSNVQTVQITVGGVPVNIPDPGAIVADRNPLVDPRAAILRDDKFGLDTGDGIVEVEGLSEKVVELAPTSVSLASSRVSAAVGAVEGVYAVSTGSVPPLLVDDRAGLIAPSIDNSGFIWSAPSAQASALTVFELGGIAHPIASTIPPEDGITSMAVSRDGARILFALTTPSGPRLVVAGIIRDASVPIAIGPLVELDSGGGAIIGATWVDSRSVAALTAGEAEISATLHVIGGPSSDLPSLVDGVAIIGGNGEAGLRVLRSDGAILVQRGSAWQETGGLASLIATQQ